MAISRSGEPSYVKCGRRPFDNLSTPLLRRNSVLCSTVPSYNQWVSYLFPDL